MNKATLIWNSSIRTQGSILNFICNFKIHDNCYDENTTQLQFSSDT